MSAIDTSTGRVRTPETARAGLLWRNLPLLGFIVLLLALTAVPYLYGYLSAPAGRVFQGVVFDVPDVMQYFSWMRDHHTHLLVPNRMTSEPNDPALFNSLWLVLAQVQQLTGWSNAAIFQLLRLVSGAAFLLTLWWFVGLFLPQARQRWTAYLVITLGGGLGWIWVIEKYVRHLSDVSQPLDLYVVEPNAFFALLALPHLLLAATMICAIFGLFIQAEQRGNEWRRYGAAALIALALGLSHTYDLIMVYAVLISYVLLQMLRARRILWGQGLGLAAIGLLSSPPAAYFTYLTARNPLWKEVLSQFDNAGIFTPNLLHIWVLLGVPALITALAGLGLLVRRGTRAAVMPATPRATFLWVWVVVGFGLLYIPTNFQIKMLNPYQVPLALIATAAVARFAAARFPRRAALALALLVALTLPANLYIFSWRLLELRRADVPFYLSSSQSAALRWLDGRSAEAAVVLSGLDIGQYIAADTGHRSFLGHWAQTAHYFAKRDTVAAFFAANTPAATRHALLQHNDVRYVIYGPEERRLGGFDPATDPQFQQVFAAGDTAIFAVQR